MGNHDDTERELAPGELDGVVDRSTPHHLEDKPDASDQLAPFATSLVNHGIVAPAELAKHMLRLAEEAQGIGDTSLASYYVEIAYDLFDRAYI